jgi:protease I
MSRNSLICLLGVLILLLAGCGPFQATGKPGTKQVLMILPEQSDDMDFMLTQEVGVMNSALQKAGFKVVVATVYGRTLQGSAQSLKPDLKLADVKVEDYDGLVLPCLAVGFDMARAPEAIELVKKAVALGKPVAAQVGGILVLSDAGVLKGKQYSEIVGLILNTSGGVAKGNGVVQDGNIITSGVCPFMARMNHMKDGTPELTQKFIDTLQASR